MANRLPLERVKEGFRTSPIIEYSYANYDFSIVKADFEVAQRELSALQLALDSVNTTVKFTVELDMEF